MIPAISIAQVRSGYQATRPDGASSRGRFPESHRGWLEKIG